MNFLKTMAVSMALVVAGASAHAATLDFVAEANNNGERGVADGTVITFDGLDVKFSAGPEGAAGPANYAYFDKDYGNAGPEDDAGLGVCTTLSGRFCAPSSDDNISAGEFVTLMFDKKVEISGLYFNKATHGPVDGSQSLQINGIAMTFDAASAMSFVGTSITYSYENYLYYVGGATATVVPLPAAGWLMLAGLGGLAAMRRKKS